MAIDFNARVIYKNELTPSLMILRVAPLNGDVSEFKAGQYTTIGLPETAERSPLADKEDKDPSPTKWIKRAYSIASSSMSKEYIEFYVMMVYSGALTPRLFALKEGDMLWMAPKIVGHFTMDHVPEDQNIVFIATGTGLAPYMSMLRSKFVCGVNQKFAVLHGARHSWDLGYRSELSSLQTQCPNFTYLPIIDHPHEEITEWKGQVGFVQSLWQNGTLEKNWGFKPTHENTHIFLCGNPLMIEDTTKMLAEEGFNEHSKAKPGQIHVEKYW